MIYPRDIPVIDVTHSEDIASGTRVFQGELRLAAGYRVTSRALDDIGRGFVDAAIRRQIMRHMYGDLSPLLSVLDELRVGKDCTLSMYPPRVAEAIESLRDALLSDGDA